MICIEPIFNLQLKNGIPSCLDIGLRAGQKGDFDTARRMMRTAMEQLNRHQDQLPRMILLTTYIADTYMNEGRYDSAKECYRKALQRAQGLHGINCLQAGCLMAKLAELCVLQAEISEFQRYFEQIMRVYLLSEEADSSVLLSALIDLSWALCLHGYIVEVREVNNLIAQIETLEKERSA